MCVLGLAILVTRESNANRAALDASLLSEAEMVESMAFDQAIQSAAVSNVITHFQLCLTARGWAPSSGYRS